MQTVARVYCIRFSFLFDGIAAIDSELAGRQYEVKAVLDQWYEPDSISYKVKADDGNFYILRHETSKPSGTWDLVSFRRSGNER